MNKLLNQENTGQYVVFAIGKQSCALPIEEVVEIVRIQTITEVPGVKHFISGMINLRGKIIPVIHLGQRYHKVQNPFQKKSRIIIITDQDEDIGLIVDDVLMVTHVQEADLEPPLEMFNLLEKDCFKSFVKTGEQLIGILNIKKTLYPEL